MLVDKKFAVLKKKAVEETLGLLRERLNDKSLAIPSLVKTINDLERSRLRLLERVNALELPGDEKAKIVFGIQSALSVLEKEQKQVEKTLEWLMLEQAPELTRVAGFKLGARLIEKAGSLEKLARMPSSTIQVLGAEKAFFAHVRKGVKAPKHGLENSVLLKKTSATFQCDFL